MQTFLPYRSFSESARSLDTRRLNNQSNECKALWPAILKKPGAAWSSHPAAVMWVGHQNHFLRYWVAILDEMAFRRSVPEAALSQRYRQVHALLTPELNNSTYPEPWWLGVNQFHQSHRNNLVRKDPHHYRFNTTDSPGYWWPNSTPGVFMYLESGKPETRRMIIHAI